MSGEDKHIEGTAIITSVCWVSRGYASQVYKEYEPTEEEK